MYCHVDDYSGYKAVRQNFNSMKHEQMLTIIVFAHSDNGSWGPVLEGQVAHPALCQPLQQARVGEKSVQGVQYYTAGMANIRTVCIIGGM